MKIKIALLLALTSLCSCTPTSYIVNIAPYSEGVANNSSAVVVEAKDVIPVGGFQPNLEVVVATDFGEIGYGEDGITGTVVIDLESDK